LKLLRFFFATCSDIYQRTTRESSWHQLPCICLGHFVNVRSTCIDCDNMVLLSVICNGDLRKDRPSQLSSATSAPHPVCFVATSTSLDSQRKVPRMHDHKKSPNSECKYLCSVQSKHPSSTYHAWCGCIAKITIAKCYLLAIMHDWSCMWPQVSRGQVDYRKMITISWARVHLCKDGFFRYHGITLCPKLCVLLLALAQPCCPEVPLLLCACKIVTCATRK
jgi:hypothetical protein